MTGVWRDKNGTPLTRVKQLAPGKSKEQLSQEQFAFSHRRKMIEQDKAQYQAEQRHRPTYGRDMMTGKKMKPRKVCEGPEAEFNRKHGMRLRKSTTIVDEEQAQFEAARDGVIAEPDTKRGLDQWQKMKHEKGAWTKLITPRMKEERKWSK